MSHPTPFPPTLPPLNVALEERVLTHGNSTSANQGLAILGDAVMGLCALSFFFHPHISRGDLTGAKVTLINTTAKATAAVCYGLPPRIITSSDTRYAVMASETAQSTVFGAWVGGVFLEHGFEIARRWLFAYWQFISAGG